MAKKPKPQPSKGESIAAAVVVAVIIVVFIVAANRQTTHKSTPGGPSNQAVRFVSAQKSDIRTVQVDVQQIEAEIQIVAASGAVSDLVTLAADAKSNHDELTNIKPDFAVAADGTGAIETYEAALYDAVNTLKNAMGTVVTFANNGGAGTLGTLQDQLAGGIAEWNTNIVALYSAAHIADAPKI